MLHSPNSALAPAAPGLSRPTSETSRPRRWSSSPSPPCSRPAYSRPCGPRSICRAPCGPTTARWACCCSTAAATSPTSCSPSGSSACSPRPCLRRSCRSSNGSSSSRRPRSGSAPPLAPCTPLASPPRPPAWGFISWRLQRRATRSWTRRGSRWWPRRSCTCRRRTWVAPRGGSSRSSQCERERGQDHPSTCSQKKSVLPITPCPF
mmetsp:Transcript_12853/g.41072  ORF Transcript_12853/g.41072 Transcript_12853/m.41072 type:complete len:206 (-) Transcript_12853:6-623(-)